MAATYARPNSIPESQWNGMTEAQQRQATFAEGSKPNPSFAPNADLPSSISSPGPTRTYSALLPFGTPGMPVSPAAPSVPGAGGFGYNDPNPQAPPSTGLPSDTDTSSGSGFEPGAILGGAWDWLKNAFSGVSGGDVLKAAGTGVGSALDYAAREAQRKQQQQQFEAALGQRKAESDIGHGEFGQTLAEKQAEFGRTQGDTEGQLAVNAATKLNQAPLADKSTALLLARMGAAPQTFQPRDLTRGTNSLTGGPTGGPQSVTDAMRKAAGAYKPGAGGVDTSTLQLLLNKMRGSAFAPNAPASPATPTTGIHPTGPSTIVTTTEDNVPAVAPPVLPVVHGALGGNTPAGNAIAHHNAHLPTPIAPFTPEPLQPTDPLPPATPTGPRLPPPGWGGLPPGGRNPIPLPDPVAPAPAVPPAPVDPRRLFEDDAVHGGGDGGGGYVVPGRASQISRARR